MDCATNAIAFWNHLSHLTDANGVKHLHVTTYNIYSAIINYSDYGEIPPTHKLSPVQRILCTLNKNGGTLILGRLENNNEDLRYNMKIWPKINWRFVEDAHTKMVIYTNRDDVTKVWVGSANLSGSIRPNLMLEINDNKQRKLVLEHYIALSNQSIKLKSALKLASRNASIKLKSALKLASRNA
jgi:hypothetical protein